MNSDDARYKNMLYMGMSNTYNYKKGTKPQKRKSKPHQYYGYAPPQGNLRSYSSRY